jgi:hypothetical protein
LRALDDGKKLSDGQQCSEIFRVFAIWSRSTAIAGADLERDRRYSFRGCTTTTRNRIFEFAHGGDASGLCRRPLFALGNDNLALMHLWSILKSPAVVFTNVAIAREHPDRQVRQTQMRS